MGACRNSLFPQRNGRSHPCGSKEKGKPRHQAQAERTFCHLPIIPGTQVGTGISSGYLSFAFPLTLHKMMMMMMVITFGAAESSADIFFFVCASSTRQRQRALTSTRSQLHAVAPALLWGQSCFCDAPQTCQAMDGLFHQPIYICPMQLQMAGSICILNE